MEKVQCLECKTISPSDLVKCPCCDLLLTGTNRVVGDQILPYEDLGDYFKDQDDQEPIPPPEMTPEYWENQEGAKVTKFGNLDEFGGL